MQHPANDDTIQYDYELTIVVKPIVISHGTVEDRTRDSNSEDQHGERGVLSIKESVPLYYSPAIQLASAAFCECLVFSNAKGTIADENINIPIIIICRKKG